MVSFSSFTCAVTCPRHIHIRTAWWSTRRDPSLIALYSERYSKDVCGPSTTQPRGHRVPAVWCRRGRRLPASLVEGGWVGDTSSLGREVLWELPGLVPVRCHLW